MASTTTLPLIKKFQRAGQGQVFAFFDQLKAAEKKRLLAEAAEIDLKEVAYLTDTLLKQKAAGGVDLEGLSPGPYAMVWSCRGHSPPLSQTGQSRGWFTNRNSSTPSWAFLVVS
ncbi:MAG: hypothetical protein V4773_24770, partial [Verrucomicrobiota bacterium]